MVHALEEIHRLLNGDGCLIDIHPIRNALGVEVHHHGEIVFVEHVPGSDVEAVQQAEAALAQVVARHLFRREESTTFDHLTYGDSVPELRDYLIESSAFKEDGDAASRWENERAETARRAAEALHRAGPGARVVLREQARITRLRALSP